MFQLSVCSGCHDALKMSIDINSIVTLNIRELDQCSIFNEINKSEAIKLFKNPDLREKKWSIAEYKLSL